jgi:hypothetical protein
VSNPRWFKLAVRAIGLLLLGFAIPAVFNLISYASNFRTSIGFEPDKLAAWITAVAYAIGVIAQTTFSLYLLFGAPALVRYCIEQVATRCIQCDYDIRGLTGKCPECGLEIGPTLDPPAAPPAQDH